MIEISTTEKLTVPFVVARALLLPITIWNRSFAIFGCEPIVDLLMTWDRWQIPTRSWKRVLLICRLMTQSHYAPIS